MSQKQKRKWAYYVPAFVVLLLLIPVGFFLTRVCEKSGEGREVIRLWKGDAPGAIGQKAKDIPTLTVYKPEGTPNGKAVIICPGGCYFYLAVHEGEAYAEYLNQFGVTAFVLKNRLIPRYKYPTMFWDVTRAMRLVRYHAPEWGLDPNQIAIMGSSAGGHLAAMLMTQFEPADPTREDPIDRVSSRPDLGILCYSVLKENTYFNTVLLEDDATEAMRDAICPYKFVTKDTTPCFIWHTAADLVVPVEDSLTFAATLRKAGVPFELHIYERGLHGMGLGIKNDSPHPWVSDLIHWLRERQFIGTESTTNKLSEINTTP